MSQLRTALVAGAVLVAGLLHAEDVQWIDIWDQILPPEKHLNESAGLSGWTFDSFWNYSAYGSFLPQGMTLFFN